MKKIAEILIGIIAGIALFALGFSQGFNATGIAFMLGGLAAFGATMYHAQ